MEIILVHGWKVLEQKPGGREAKEYIILQKERLAQILRVGIYCHHAATFVYDMLWIRIS